MAHTLKTIKLMLLGSILLSAQIINAQTKIGGTAGAGDASAVLELQSAGNNQGFLPVRLTTAQRNAITTPATGLTIYNTDDQCLNIYKGSTNGWFNMCSGAGGFSFTNCASPTIVGTFTALSSASATITLNYVNNTGQTYGAFSSSVVDGITLTATGGSITTLTTGSGTITLTASGTPTAGGSFTIPVVLAGTSCGIPITVGAAVGNVPVACGTAPGCTGGVDPSVAVAGDKICWGGFTYFAMTYQSRIWLDRNLGATQVATSLTDANALGDIYQWGRTGDGHQCRTAASVTGPITASQLTDPTYAGKFIMNASGTLDWLNPQDDQRWNNTASGGAANPCPPGWRLPTQTEFTPGTTGVGSSALFAQTPSLKMPIATARNQDGTMGASQDGRYWTSTVSSNLAVQIGISSAGYLTGYDPLRRACGLAVRCIKN